MTLTRLIIALVFTLLAAPCVAQPVFPPGSRIGITPAPGMTPSTSFQGFEDRAKGAMLVLTELSVQSYAKVEQDLSPEQMRAAGMETIARGDLSLPAGVGTLVVARQAENGVMMHKWALLTRTGDMTAIVVATMPEAARDTYPDAILRAALASVVIRPKLAAAEMLAILPYTLGDLGGFHVMRTAPDGMAVLTFGPADTSLPVEQPYFIVAPRAVEPPPQAERDRFAQRALMTFATRPDQLRIVTSESVRIGGAQGHEIVAQSKDERTGDELMLVQWLRFGGGGLIQMFGIARKDQWADVLPRMRAVRDGFSLK
jgi:hypothetical protein